MQEPNPTGTIMATETELARREARAWKERANEAERARARVVRRIQAARRDVYDANFRAEKAEARAQQAEVIATDAEARATQAQIHLDRALENLDAVLSSTAWRATWPIRATVNCLPLKLRRLLRTGVKLGWWSLTLKLPSKLKERRTVQRRTSTEAHVASIRHSARARPVTAAKIDCRKIPTVRTETSLFVTHSPSGHLRPHVREYLNALVREGIGVVLIVATDREFVDDEPWLYELTDGLFVRVNEGFDFAAWAHVLRLYPQLHRVKTLYLLNDSVMGPVSVTAFHAAIERVRTTPVDIVGMTENYEPEWHIQSYFLVLKKRAMRSAAWNKFVQSVESLTDKDEVVSAYEVPFASVMAMTGLKTAVLFKTRLQSDPTVYSWKELLEAGFPFLKIKTVRDEIPGVDKAGWRQALEGLGFDISIADKVLANNGGARGPERTPGPDSGHVGQP